jgi:hypothetical protein
MGQVLDGSATTTEAVRRAIQHSQESLRGLAKRYGVNPKTVAKWKVRTSVSDLPTGPKEPRSTVLSGEEEAVVIAFRRHTLLPLDDCLYGFSQPSRICCVLSWNREPATGVIFIQSDPVALGPHWPPGFWEAAIGMLVVATIAKIRRAYFFLVSRSRRSAASCTYRARLCGRSFARTPPSSITNVRANRFPGLGLGDSGLNPFWRRTRARWPVSG